MSHKITELIKGVFLLEFDNRYDLAMHFCRYQEFYESHNPDFQGKSFNMFDFMRWYSTENSNRFYKKLNCFTYPEDWAGFNIPSWVFDKLKMLGIQDINRYDIFMFDLHKQLTDQHRGKYYLIGACQGEAAVIAHEIAHGLYYSNANYREEISVLINSFNSSFKEKLYSYLKDLGYAESVIPDEAQAFLSTGFSKKQLQVLAQDFKCDPTGNQGSFEKVFKRYAKNIPALKEYFSGKS